jgi:hypothetical protein
MKSLPELIADGAAFFGLIPKTNSAGVVVTTASTRRDAKSALWSKVTNGSAGENYDGDAEFIGMAEPKYIPFNLTAETDPDGKPFEVSATLFEVSIDGKQYRLQKYPTKKALAEAFNNGVAVWSALEKANRLIEVARPSRLKEAATHQRDATLEEVAQRVLEHRLSHLEEAHLEEDETINFETGGYPGGFGGGSSFNNSWTPASYGSGWDANAEYIPLMGGPYSKQLYQYQYLDMHRKAFEAYNHSPIAHQLCELQTAFILGRGLDHKCSDPDVEEVWAEYVQRTTFYDDLEQIATDMWWAGESFTEFLDDEPNKGQTDYRMQDPSTIWDIICEPEDMQHVYYLHQQYPTPYQMYTEGNIQATKYIIRHIPASAFIQYKLNCSKWEKRGRSDLFSILGWLKRFKDAMNARVIKLQLEAAFAFDVEVDGSQAQVTATNTQLPDPFTPGQIFFHNKGMKLSVVEGSKGSSADSLPDIDNLLNTIAVGAGVPKEFLGMASKGAKSGALTAVEPGSKKFERRQRFLERYCYDHADRVIINAIKAGKIDIDKVLQNASSVVKLGQANADVPTRDEVSDEMEDKNQEFADQQQQQQQDQMDFQNKTTMLQMRQQHELALQDQKNQHRQGLASIKSNPVKTVHNIDEKRKTVQPAPTMQESLREAEAVFEDWFELCASIDVRVDDPQFITRVMEGTRTAQKRVSSLRQKTKPKSKKPTSTNIQSDEKPEMNADQKRRIQAIKDSQSYAREFIEFIFPNIVQEDRSSLLKDIALMEAMQWLPKSVAATMAAKEVNITTYNFEVAWAQILEESKLGLSIAHVYSQDNQHTPETAIAQDVQEEQQAKMPIAPQNQMVNVPTPPAVAGDKLMPAGQPGQGGSTPPKPGTAPQSGSTKVNQAASPGTPDPTQKAPGYSAAGNHPMSANGKENLLKHAREAVRNEIVQTLLREALGPAIEVRTQLAKAIMGSDKNFDAFMAEFNEHNDN